MTQQGIAKLCFDLYKYTLQNEYDQPDQNLYQQILKYDELIQNVKDLKKKIQFDQKLSESKDTYIDLAHGLLQDNNFLRKNLLQFDQKLQCLLQELKILRSFKMINESQQIKIKQLQQENKKICMLKQLFKEVRNVENKVEQESNYNDSILQEQRNKLLMLKETIQLRQQQVHHQQNILIELKTNMEFRQSVQQQLMNNLSREIQRYRNLYKKLEQESKIKLLEYNRCKVQQELIRNYEKQILRFQTLETEYLTKIQKLEFQRKHQQQNKINELKKINKQYKLFKHHSQTKINQLTNNIDNLVEKYNKDINELNHTHQKQMKQANMNYKLLENKYVAKQHQYELKLKQNRTNQDQIKQYQQNLRILQQKNQNTLRLKNKLNQAQQKYDKCFKRLKDSLENNVDIQRLTNQNSLIKKKLQTLQMENKQLKYDKIRLTKQLQVFEQELERDFNENDKGSQIKIQKLSKQIQKLNQSMKKMISENNNKKSLYEKDIQNLKTQIMIQVKQNNQLKKVNQNLVGQLKQKNKQIADNQQLSRMTLQQKLTDSNSLKNELQSLKQQLESKKEQIDQYKQLILIHTSRQKQLEEIQEKIGKYEQVLQEKQQIILNLDKQILSLQTKIQQLIEQRQKSIKQITLHLSKQAKYKQNIEILNQEIISLKLQGQATTQCQGNKEETMKIYQQNIQLRQSLSKYADKIEQAEQYYSQIAQFIQISNAQNQKNIIANNKYLQYNSKFGQQIRKIQNQINQQKNLSSQNLQSITNELTKIKQTLNSIAQNTNSALIQNLEQTFYDYNSLDTISNQIISGIQLLEKQKQQNQIIRQKIAQQKKQLNQINQANKMQQFKYLQQRIKYLENQLSYSNFNKQKKAHQQQESQQDQVIQNLNFIINQITLSNAM